MQDDYVKKAVDMFSKFSLALVGIGTLEPSKLLANSGNVFSEEELNELKEDNAFGDICLHFFNKSGNPIKIFLTRIFHHEIISQLSTHCY